MTASVIGFALGLVLGAAAGSDGAAFGGAMLGMLVGLGVHGIAWARARLGDEPVVERHRAMCTPYGHAAEIELVGDAGTGKWFDVKRCSLLEDPAHVDCDKGCVKLMNLSGTRPGGHCPECARAAGARI